MITGVGLTYIRSKVTAYRKNLILRKEKKKGSHQSLVYPRVLSLAKNYDQPEWQHSEH